MSEAICGVGRIYLSFSAPKGLNRFAVLSKEVTIPYHGFHPRLFKFSPFREICLQIVTYSKSVLCFHRPLRGRKGESGSLYPQASGFALHIIQRNTSSTCHSDSEIIAEFLNPSSIYGDPEKRSFKTKNESMSSSYFKMDVFVKSFANKALISIL